jgi:hypothetical protein
MTDTDPTTAVLGALYDHHVSQDCHPGDTYPAGCNEANREVTRTVGDLHQFRGVVAAPDPLETAVANALSAATEGGSYTEAPEPSDEPGSPYVRLVAASLRAAGVVVAPDSLDHTAREAVIAGVALEGCFDCAGLEDDPERRACSNCDRVLHG